MLLIGSKIVALTISLEEPKFLPKWVEHYGKVADHLAVLYQGDPKWDGLSRVEAEIIHDTPGWTHKFDRNSLELVEVAKRFLKHYDILIFSDTDEFIFWEGDLDEIVAGRPYKAVQGFNVVHMPLDEPLEWDIPLLQQRDFWFPDPMENKPLIITAPTPWGPGIHKVGSEFIEPDKRLFLAHMKYADVDTLVERNRRNYPEGKAVTDYEQAWDIVQGLYNQDLDTIPEWIREAGP